MKNKKAFISLIFILSLVVAGGSFGKSFLMRECSNIAKQMKSAENDLRALNRENDFWDAEIAKVHAPAFLREKAGEKLAPPSSDKLVLAYQITEISADGQKSVKRMLARRSGSQRTIRTAQR